MSVTRLATGVLALAGALLIVHGLGAVMSAAREGGPVQWAFVEWLARMATVDFGQSLRTGQSVSALVADRVGLTSQLAGAALLIAAGAAWVTVRVDVPGRLVARLAVLVGASPAFLLAIVMIGVFAFRLGWLPASVLFGDFGSFGARMNALALPVLTLALATWAALHAEWTASMRVGASGSQGLLAVMPVLVGGVLVIETAFAVPGLGRAFVRGVAFRDAPVVEAVAFLGVLVLAASAGLAAALRPAGSAVPPAPAVPAEPTSARERVAAAWMPVLWLLAVVGTAALAPVLPLPSPDTTDLSAPHVRPGLAHLLGTDGLGRDLASRLVHGTGTTLLPAATAVAVACALCAVGLAVRHLGSRLGAAPRATLGGLALAPALVPALAVAMLVVGAFGYGPLLVGSMVGLALAPRWMRFHDRAGGSLSMRAAAFSATALVAAEALATVATLGAFRFATGVDVGGWGLQIGEAQEHLEYAPHQLLAPAVALVITGVALHVLAGMVFGPERRPAPSDVRVAAPA